MENDVLFSQLEHCTINGRNVWLYEIQTPIGNFYVVDAEDKYQQIQRLLHTSKQSAEAQFEKICIKMLKGVL